MVFMEKQHTEEVAQSASCPICGRQLNNSEAKQFLSEGKFECGDCGATVAPSEHSTGHGHGFESTGCGCGGQCGCGGH